MINKDLLPVPLKYTFLAENFPLYYSHKRSNDRIIKYVYVPEVNRYVRSGKEFRRTINTRNIDLIEWETRWILRDSPSNIGTENWAIKYIQMFYFNRPPITKEFIKNKLIEDPHYVCDFFCLKEDIINLYKSERLSAGKLVYNYDFSKLPDVIETMCQKFELFCLEINPFTNKPYGSYKTDYYHLIKMLRDIPTLANKVAGNKRVKRENSSGESISKHIEEIKNLIRDGYSLSEVGERIGNITGSRISKILNQKYKLTATELKGDRAMSSGERIVKEFLEKNNIEFKTQVSNKNIEGRNKKLVRIDFQLVYLGKIIWIEYNGKQHYEPIEFFTSKNKESFENQLKRDKNVRIYCKKNNIKLIEIPYILNTTNTISEFLNKVLIEGIDQDTLINYNELYGCKS